MKSRRQYLTARLRDVLIEHADHEGHVVLITPGLLHDLADLVAEIANEIVQDGFAEQRPVGCDTD
jgi:hypothetical protein